MTIEQKLLSVKQVSVILNVSRGGVYRLIREGKIPHVAVGGRRMVSLETLQSLLAKGTVEVSPAEESSKRRPKAGELREQRRALYQAAAAIQAAAELMV